MLGYTSQYLVIDDNKEHLKIISEGLSQLGLSSLSIHYTDQLSLPNHNKIFYSSTRIIFCDLHLMNIGGTGYKSHYSNIVRLIEDLLDENHPPYLLILWTAHPGSNDEHKDGIMSYFSAANTKKPIDILCFSKRDVIDELSGTGTPNAKFIPELEKKIKENEGLNALLQWDSEIRKATNNTLLAIENLALIGVTKDISFAESTSNMLKVFAREAVGKKHLTDDPSHAINLALAPIINDNLIYSQPKNSFWNDFLLQNNDPKNLHPKISDPKIVGYYNQLFHLKNEDINKLYLGAIIELPFSALNFFNINSSDKESLIQIEEFTFLAKKNITLYATKVSASCDYAQSKEGSELYYLTFQISHIDKEQSLLRKFDEYITKRDYLWKSPMFFDTSQNNCYIFFVNMKRTITFHQISQIFNNQEQEMKIRYRFKDQLILQLQRKIAEFHSRVGITEIRLGK